MTRVNARNPAHPSRVLLLPRSLARRAAAVADNECRPMQIGLIEFQSALPRVLARARARAPARIRFFGADFCSWLFTTINSATRIAILTRAYMRSVLFRCIYCTSLQFLFLPRFLSSLGYVSALFSVFKVYITLEKELGNFQN